VNILTDVSYQNNLFSPFLVILRRDYTVSWKNMGRIDSKFWENEKQIYRTRCSSLSSKGALLDLLVSILITLCDSCDKPKWNVVPVELFQWGYKGCLHFAINKCWHSVYKNVNEHFFFIWMHNRKLRPSNEPLFSSYISPTTIITPISAVEWFTF
jgi:hypothetical protein